MGRRALKNRELLKKLRRYGIETFSQRGKGSEKILLKPEPPGSRKGAQYPIKDHGPGTEQSAHVIDKILARFEIDPKDFWG